MTRNQRDLGLRKADGSGRGEKRHVSAIVSRVFPDRVSHDGAEHQHVWIAELKALDGGEDYAGDVFVAIRITAGGIGHDIPFEEATPVEMQGLFIPADEAEPGEDEDGLPVLHATHRPVGFVVYESRTYD